MKKISAKDAYKIMARLGLDSGDDGTTFFAYDEVHDEVFQFDTKKERDQFVRRHEEA